MTVTRYLVLAVFPVLALALSTCELYNPEEGIPTYLILDSIQLIENPEAPAGSLSHDICDAWVLVNDNSIGIYEMPAKIPILGEGTVKLTIGAGIKVSAQSALRTNYLFYEGYQNDDFQLEPGKSISITPTVRYRTPGSSYAYLLVEDFENNTLALDTLASGSEAAMVITNDPDLVYEGAGSGLITVKEGMSNVNVRTAAYTLPNKGKKVFMELDYYTELNLSISVYIKNNTYRDEVVDYITLKPTNGTDRPWKKLYLDLTSVISDAANPIEEYVYFTVNFNDSEATSGRILMDNLKFVYQQ